MFRRRHMSAALAALLVFGMVALGRVLLGQSWPAALAAGLKNLQ